MKSLRKELHKSLSYNTIDATASAAGGGGSWRRGVCLCATVRGGEAMIGSLLPSPQRPSGGDVNINHRCLGRTSPRLAISINIKFLPNGRSKTEGEAHHRTGRPTCGRINSVIFSITEWCCLSPSERRTAAGILPDTVASLRKR